MDLSTLVKMSNTYGSNPAYVLAGGGNTSVKDDTTLYVKGSGTQLATIKSEEFVEMSRARLNEIMKTDYPEDDVKLCSLNAKLHWMKFRITTCSMNHSQYSGIRR